MRDPLPPPGRSPSAVAPRSLRNLHCRSSLLGSSHHEEPARLRRGITPRRPCRVSEEGAGRASRCTPIPRIPWQNRSRAFRGPKEVIMGRPSAARHVATAAALVALLIAILPALSAAQEPARSFDQLNALLKVGETVWLTDGQGRQVTGRIAELHDASITVEGDSGGTFPAEAVREIQHTHRDSVWTGGLIGLGSGMVTGFVLAGNACGKNAECRLHEGLFGALGLGIGLIADALSRDKVVAYRAARPSPGTHVSVKPLISPRTKGVAVSLAF